MSIYASLEGIQDARDYHGAHVVPSETERTAASVDLALIPSHITRDGRDDQPEDERPWPWLRMETVTSAWDQGPVVVNPAQARDLARQLTEWADTAEPTESTEHEEHQP